jgi:hypothetical protein
MGSLLIILILNVHEKGLNIFWFGITSVFIKGQVIVSQFTFVLSHVLDKRLVFSFEGQVSLVVLVDLLNFNLHFVNFTDDLSVLVFKQVVVVGSIIDLSTWSFTDSIDT